MQQSRDNKALHEQIMEDLHETMVYFEDVIEENSTSDDDLIIATVQELEQWLFNSSRYFSWLEIFIVIRCGGWLLYNWRWWNCWDSWIWNKRGYVIQVHPSSNGTKMHR